jgi:flagellar biosynthesis/type III secretory pathway protein FliH
MTIDVEGIRRWLEHSVGVQAATEFCHDRDTRLLAEIIESTLDRKVKYAEADGQQMGYGKGYSDGREYGYIAGYEAGKRDAAKEKANT